MDQKKPNVVIVFGDQWRAQATGYAGDPNVKTPNLDKLAAESVNLRNAVAGCPVCCPARASLITGQYPLTHGVFVNNVPLKTGAVCLGEAFAGAGYDTAYIGKWHIDGHGRSEYIPPERRRGFDYWKVLECTHDYYRSVYYAGDSDKQHVWEGYDAFAQTGDAIGYIQKHNGEHPFLLMLSWGPPHDPYETAPPKFKALYDPRSVRVRSNVPGNSVGIVKRFLAGYYAHCSALDACLGALLKALGDKGIANETIFVFMSDHGDMLGSRGLAKKQQPWDEAVRIPLLMRIPGDLVREAGSLDVPVNMPDIMPTLLGLAGIPVPATVEGADLSPVIRGESASSEDGALIACYQPFGEWSRANGGCEYRGLRTSTHTYVRTLSGPWLLYDNQKDPHQLENLIDHPACEVLRKQLDEQLWRKLGEVNDEFLTGKEYLHQWGYRTDVTGTVPIKW